MENYEGHARSLSQLYVFYQRLKYDGSYPFLAKAVESSAFRIQGQTEKYANNTVTLRIMASIELEKEKALLDKIFNVHLNLTDYNTPGSFQQVLDAINSCLNLKEVYERNILLIQQSDGQKGVYSWYPTYFIKAWDEGINRIVSKFSAAYLKSGDLGKTLGSILEVEVKRICQRGIQLMLDGPELENTFLKENRPDLKQAYSSLLSNIGKVGQSGSLADQIYKAYKLDEIKNILVSNLNKKIDTKKFRQLVENKVKTGVHSKGGLTLEAIETAIFQQILGAMKGGAVFHSGDIGIKADNIATMNMDISAVEEALKQAQGNRDSNIKAFKELGEKLSGVKDGFIIYSSDKNYTLNGDFGGFNVGSLGTNAQDFISNVFDGSSGMTTLLGAIQQLGSGAILEGQSAVFEDYLAQQVAYMLFDDFSTIGSNSSSTGNAIHVMNLNGVMVPMSMILSTLADAIDQVLEIDPRDIVRVKIDAPAILFPTQASQDSWQEVNNASAGEAWAYQRAYALANTQIHAKILKNFKALISQYIRL